MAHGPPIPLTAVLIGLGSNEFQAISGWPFADPFVKRLLQDAINEKALIRAAVALNTSARAAARPARSQKRTARNRLN